MTSILLGPPSDTINSVSERASALAWEMMPGAAGNAAPAARPETDFKKSRRFIRCSPVATGRHSQASCQRKRDAKCLKDLGNVRIQQLRSSAGLAYKGRVSAQFEGIVSSKLRVSRAKSAPAIPRDRPLLLASREYRCGGS